MSNDDEPNPKIHKVSFSSCIDGNIMLVLKGNETDEEITESIERVLSEGLKTVLKGCAHDIVIDNTVIIEK